MSSSLNWSNSIAEHESEITSHGNFIRFEGNVKISNGEEFNNIVIDKSKIVGFTTYIEPEYKN